MGLLLFGARPSKSSNPACPLEIAVMPARKGVPPKPEPESRSDCSQVTFDWSSLDKKALHQTLKRLFDQMDKNHDQKAGVPVVKRFFVAE